MTPLTKKTTWKRLSKYFQKTFANSEGEEVGKVLGVFARAMMETTPEQDLQVFITKDEEKIVGGVMFSTLTLEGDKTAKLLSPMAVSTEVQGKGIGQGLINHALDILKSQGVDIAVTYGDPNFYSRVGFAQISEDIIKAPLPLSFPEGWLGQSLNGETLEAISGESGCVSALNNPSLW
ncbi:GNAT family N-acetyltransferase [Grimontia sp. NTOU-MAR1]|uniref:GNAT family N-acetyltransferase n=1 Tax=Grimontia sp. NTOU-MAR1 TaxID=3111011 RepID=UPI002DBF3617|nr:N-acetyltransferase [Grimontia sp. NTOU-MAR1]WRW01080.1 N-acetyltransferase [Grimontia sp. NTOU-MAR1]